MRSRPTRSPRTSGAFAATGAVGCNFEDQVVDGDSLYPVAVQAERIAAIRRALFGPDFFLNARTDIFLRARRDTHAAAMVEAAIERGRAYAEAGASGIFVPVLADLACSTASARPRRCRSISWPGPARPSAAEVGGGRRRADQPRPLPLEAGDEGAQGRRGGGDGRAPKARRAPRRAGRHPNRSL